MSTSPTYFRNMAFMVAQTIGIRALGFVSSLVLAHALGPAGLGSYSIANATANGFGRISRVGIDIGVQSVTARCDPASEADIISDVLGSALTLFLFISLIDAAACLLLSSTIAARMFGDASLAPFIALAAPLVVLQIFAQYAYAAFAGLHHFTLYSRAVSITAAFPPGLAILGGLTGDAFTAVLGFVVGQGIVTIFCLSALFRLGKRFNVRLTPRVSFSRFALLLKSGFPFYASLLLIVPAEYYADSLIVLAHGTQELGNLRIVVAVSTIVSLIPSAINGPMLSRFVQTEHQDADIHNRFVLFNIKVLLTFGLIVVAVGAPWWTDAVRLLFGAKYDAAAAVGYVALLSAVLIIVLNVVANNLLATGRLGLLFSMHASYAGIFTLLSFVAIPMLGLRGYLLAQLAAYSLPLTAVTVSFVLLGNRRREEVVPVVAMVLITVAVSAVFFALYATGVETNVVWQLASSIFSIALIAWAGWQFIFAADELNVILGRISRIIAFARRH